MQHNQIHPQKEMRISMRVDAERKAVIARAAKLQHQTISNFMLQNAYSAAQDILLDQTKIVLEDEQFKYIWDMMDNPPAENVKRMNALMSSKTILD